MTDEPRIKEQNSRSALFRRGTWITGKQESTKRYYVRGERGHELFEGRRRPPRRERDAGADPGAVPATRRGIIAARA